LFYHPITGLTAEISVKKIIKAAGYMIHVLLDSVLISLLHALIPSHWLAVAAIGRTENWSLATTLKAASLAGLAHIGSTTLVGSLFGYLGYKLTEQYTASAHLITPVVLIGSGLFFLLIDRFNHHPNKLEESITKKPRHFGSLFTTITLTLFLSPCLEMTSYFLTAGTHGWWGIILVACVFMGVTLPVMLVLVGLGYKGLTRFKGTMLDRHRHTVTGLLLIGLGLLSFLYQ
jgi:hypothetical protein